MDVKLIAIIILSILLLFLILVAFMRYRNDADISFCGKLIVANALGLLSVIFIPMFFTNPLVKNSDYSKINMSKVIPLEIKKEETFIKMSQNLKFFKDSPCKDITRYSGERQGFRITDDVYNGKVIKTTCTVAIAGKDELDQNLQYMNYYLWNVFGLNTEVGKWIDSNVKDFNENSKEFSKSKNFEDKHITFQVKKESNMFLFYIQIVHK